VNRGLNAIATDRFDKPLEDFAGEMSVISETFNQMSQQLNLREAELRESEERHRDLFDNANDLIASFTREGRFLYTNYSWRKRLGYNEEEVSGIKLFDTLHPSSRIHLKEILNSVVSGEKIH
jgi:PAS domain-containing protein